MMISDAKVVTIELAMFLMTLSHCIEMNKKLLGELRKLLASRRPRNNKLSVKSYGKDKFLVNEYDINEKAPDKQNIIDENNSAFGDKEIE